MNLTIDPALIAASANLRCLIEGDTMRFLLQGESATVVALYDATAHTVELFPDRDIGHQKLAGILAP